VRGIDLGLPSSAVDLRSKPEASSTLDLRDYITVLLTDLFRWNIKVESGLNSYTIRASKSWGIWSFLLRYCGRLLCELIEAKEDSQEGLGLFWESHDCVESCERGRGPFWESQDCVESCESGIGGGGVSRISDSKRRARGGVLRSRRTSIFL
jgi:hypothetical protein